MTGTKTKLVVVLIMKPVSWPLSKSLGTLPAGTVVTGGMGGGGVEVVESDVLWGRSLEPEVTLLPWLSTGGGESGRSS
jgi:hypothetical protein